MEKKKTPTFQLDDQQFDRVMHILKEERQVCEVTRFQKIALGLLTIWTGAFVIFLFTYFVLGIRLYGYYTPYLYYLAPLLLLLNLPLLYKILRNKWMMYRLSFTKTFIKEWKLRRPKKRFISISIVTIITSIFGSLLILGAIFGIIVSERNMEDIKFILIFFGLGFTFIAFRLLVMGIERLKFLSELTNLRDSFLKLRGEQIQTPGTEVPIKDLDFVTACEQSQIARDRAKVIESYMQSATSELTEYALLKSRDFIKEIANLDLDLRLQVEEQIERLCFEPHPEGSQKDPTGDYWHLRVPETSLELKYAVDDSQLQIQIIALESVTERAPSVPLTEGRAHE